jgi:hypothetical protein
VDHPDATQVLTRSERVERRCQACMEVCRFFALHFCPVLFSRVRGNSSLSLPMTSLRDPVRLVLPVFPVLWIRSLLGACFWVSILSSILHHCPCTYPFLHHLTPTRRNGIPRCRNRTPMNPDQTSMRTNNPFPRPEPSASPTPRIYPPSPSLTAPASRALYISN